MTLSMVPPNLLPECESDMEPGDDRRHEGGEPDLCSFHITAGAVSFLDWDQSVLAALGDELRETMGVFKPLLDFREDSALQLAAWSAVMISPVLKRTSLPLVVRERSIRACVASRRTPRKYSGVDGAALCGLYFREAMCGDGCNIAPDGHAEEIRNINPKGSWFEAWLRHQCFDVSGYKLDMSRMSVTWNTLNLPQTAIFCAWTNLWTLRLLASFISDRELTAWLGEAQFELAARVEVVFAKGWSCDLISAPRSASHAE